MTRELAASILPLFALTALLIELTPGPNMAYLATLALDRGRAVAMAAVAGVALGLAIVGALAALGVAAVIEQSSLLYEVLRWLGVAYLLWLAGSGFFAGAETSGEDVATGMARGFARGLVTNLLNPKAAVFYVSMLPNFIRSDAGHLTSQTLLLGAAYVTIATAVHTAIVMAAGALRPVLVRSGTRTAIRRVLSLALAGIALWFAVVTER
jgi:threonine/homoserine/homoserine lactone efflux protein